MFPATSQSMPADRRRCPVNAVTVLLPLVPVTASTLPFADQAKSSISPTTGMFLASAARINSSSRERPGLMQTRSTSFSSEALNFPV